MLKNEIYKKVPRILRTLPINVLNILNFKHNAVKAYWYDSDINFGDLLAPTLLKKYGLFPILAEKSESDIISVGSVLDSVPLDFSGYIIGSGLLHDHKRKFSKAKILAVRGKLTRERIGAPISTVLGDPGLLSDKLISRKEKSILIGIVPHYLDKCNQAIKNINHNFSKDTRIINVQRNPKDVISEIERCSYVISSSLHGIIVADSLGIPNAWVCLSNKVLGDGFKFFDYASSYDRKIEPFLLKGDEKLIDIIRMTQKVHNGIQELKNNLDNMYNKMCNEIIANRSVLK